MSNNNIQVSVYVCSFQNEIYESLDRSYKYVSIIYTRTFTRVRNRYFENFIEFFFNNLKTSSCNI